jgi:hypothetical protein
MSWQKGTHEGHFGDVAPTSLYLGVFPPLPASLQGFQNSNFSMKIPGFEALEIEKSGVLSEMV